MWWTTMISWVLGKAWPFLWDRLKHLGVYIAILLVAGMILMKFHAFKLTQYNLGYKAGYSQALTDHPTNTVQSGGSVTYNSYNDKSGFLDLRFWRIIRVIFVPAK